MFKIITSLLVLLRAKVKFRNSNLKSSRKYEEIIRICCRS
nr:MAG TPA: hypothetical protein [Bacteriophage sp.]